MADVFISYCRSKATSELVGRIAEQLKSIGISCWYDTQGLNIGGIADFITPQIEQCKIFLLLLDEGANSSPYVFSEVHASFPLYRRQITPIPVKIGQFDTDSALMFYISPYNILSYDSPEAVPVSVLAERVAQLLNREPSAPPPEPEPPQPRIIDSGECGAYRDNVTYTLYENGQLVISGSGLMENWGYVDPPWCPKRETISNVRIQNGVTSIGKFAFYNCISLANVSIPDSVTSIQSIAFYGCKSLTSVSIPAKAKIYSNAFGEHTTVTRRK